MKPPRDVLKLNSDGSYFPNEKAGSCGFLIRDCHGDFIRAGRGRINNLLNTFQAELIACLQAVQAAADLWIGRLILETDAQEVVKALNSSLYDDSVAGHLVKEIKIPSSLNFIHFQCLFASRVCNVAAHELVKFGSVCIEGEEIISDSMPNCIFVIVANDLLAKSIE